MHPYQAILPLLRSSPQSVSRVILRNLSSSACKQASSPLFALGALSNSRETKWLSKASGISPVEYSPQLQLIRSGEGLDATQRKAKARPALDSPLKSLIRRHTRRRSIAQLDARALRMGYALLDRHSKAAERFKRALRALKSDHERQARIWSDRNRKLTKENGVASLLILLSVGCATVIALWKFTPESSLERELGRHARDAFQNQFPAMTKKAVTIDEAVPAVGSFAESAPEFADQPCLASPGTSETPSSRNWSLLSLFWAGADEDTG